MAQTYDVPVDNYVREFDAYGGAYIYCTSLLLERIGARTSGAEYMLCCEQRDRQAYAIDFMSSLCDPTIEFCVAERKRFSGELLRIAENEAVSEQHLAALREWLEADACRVATWLAGVKREIMAYEQAVEFERMNQQLEELLREHAARAS